ncbi:chemotaxis protein CheA [Paenibacillus sp. 598K]|uniref:chemotaxis protein CheA n=1 Tax=Paenibacillus sp. 598K TaxID=1117987 RepID=UPI000FFA9684|nr:chemotaxis protein CheA [Paenibacillus sp. 598K]GBF76698.1 chemotaxis protein CheA [Paenibacillus sp. 598K]
MSGTLSDDPILEMYLFESSQLIEQLEAIFLCCETSKSFSSEAVADIFRNMHTIKGSAAMMSYMSISEVAHVIEDLFYRIREDGSVPRDFDALFELIWDGLDFIKVETHKIRNGHSPDGDASGIVQAVGDYLAHASTVDAPPFAYEAVVHFTADCLMENVRAYALVHQLGEWAEVISYEPEDIATNESSAERIRESGFRIVLRSGKTEEQLAQWIKSTAYVERLTLTPSSESIEPLPEAEAQVDESGLKDHPMVGRDLAPASMISVHVDKLDKLMDLVGEMVIAEAMVTQHDALRGVVSDAFHKSAGHLRKITGELQDIVMSIRMVPLTTTFHKMHRVIRDMSKKLNKEVDIHIHGEETEVDKNIIEQISDPLMHLVRNAVDHGLEAPEARIAAGKSSHGSVTLEARNAGSDVLIIVKDDGAGLNRDKILRRALEQGLISEVDTELSDKEIYNLILLPGFSTKDDVTQYSGRGVGMDVAYRNIEQVGGAILVESVPGQGTAISLKIPLTLAIIDGMNIKVGGSYYTLPITSIQESFKPRAQDLLRDPDGNEMIMVRGECYPILRLQERLGAGSSRADISEGVLVMIHQDGRKLCVLVDELLGQQQVVVKTLPPYIKRIRPIKELAGCTLLGDGNISLILDAAVLIGGVSGRGSASLSAMSLIH